MRPLLVVFASMDPRANKIGGIETHIRHILRNHPADCDLLQVGIDEIGDLRSGRPVPVQIGGRSITFLPVAHVPTEQARVSASRLTHSTTLRFVLGAVRHMVTLRRLVAGRAASADLPRVEFAILPLLAGLPYALTVHSDLAQADKTDSLLKHYRTLKHTSERLAFAGARHVFAVNADLKASLDATFPGLEAKSSVLPAPVDTKIFRVTPFPAGDAFHLVYAGRFDEVKDPMLMFEAVRQLGERLSGKLVFHVIGAADPEAISNFAPIRSITRRHGPQDAHGVAAILAKAHCGLLTSRSEGLPCFLLETLASGRAFGAVRLPSFEPFVLPGETGVLAARAPDREATATALADALAGLWHDIRAGAFAPEAIAAHVSDYSVDSIFSQLFAVHEGIRRQPAPAEPLASARGTGLSRA